LSSGAPVGSDDARPGPGWGRAIPYVALIAIVFAIVGTVIDVHIVDGYNSAGAVSTLRPDKLSNQIASPARVARREPGEASPPAGCRDEPLARLRPAGLRTNSLAAGTALRRSGAGESSFGVEPRSCRGVAVSRAANPIGVGSS